MGLIETIIVGVFVALLSTEIQAWLPRLTEYILRYAVGRMPENLRPRYSEEWRAALNDVPGMLNKLRFACGLPWAAHRMGARPEDAASSTIACDALSRLLAAWLVFILSPLFLATAVLIKLVFRDGGPTLFMQRPFGAPSSYCVYRLRTMPIAQPQLRGMRIVYWLRRMPADQKRITRTGCWLRETGLDRFPMLINVIKGDMNLVGPRFLSSVVAKRFVKEIPNFKEREGVRYGLICPALIMGGPRILDTADEIRLDIEYARTRSLWVDAKIIIRAILLSLSITLPLSQVRGETTGGYGGSAEDNAMTHPNEDYYGWTQETAEKLRQGRLSEVNMADLIEEIEDMGRSERRALESRLKVLFVHLLKWQYQPERRDRSWRLTIEEQRTSIEYLLGDNPSLKPLFQAMGQKACHLATIAAAKEIDKDKETFPSRFEQTGWRWEKVLDPEFYPD